MLLVKKILTRLLLIPLGLSLELINLTKKGARDIHNKYRFTGVIVDKNCGINENTIIHSNVHILENCIINNCEIQSYSYIGRNSLVQNTKIGKFCSIANDVFIGLGKHPVNHFSTATIFYKKNNTLNIDLLEEDLEFNEYEQITIGNDVWIGARVIILDGVNIGDGAIVASGSIVTKNIPAYTIWGGVPAKIIKYRFNEKKTEGLVKLQWWEWELQKIKENIKKLNEIE